MADCSWAVCHFPYVLMIVCPTLFAVRTDVRPEYQVDSAADRITEQERGTVMSAGTSDVGTISGKQ